MKNITFRFAKTEDIESLIELRILMQCEVNGTDLSSVPENYKELVREYFLTNLSNGFYQCAIALSEDKIIATAGVCFYQKPPSINGGSGLVGYVTNVYTLESFRKKGIGSTLMKKLNELATDKRVDKLHLGATVDGDSIYRSVGYIEPRFLNLEIKF